MRVKCPAKAGPYVRIVAAVGLLSLAPVGSWAQDAPVPVLFRVFLTDGRAISSFGEWARIDDRVVFSMPTRGGGDISDLQLVAIPAARVDWGRTNQYAESVRGAVYAATRGESDFAKLSAETAAALNEVSRLADPGVRLATAERARRSLAEWPAAHYGYKAADVREMLATLDGIIAELRAAVGQTRFDVSLSSPLVGGPDPPLPPPSDVEVAEQLQAAASVVETATDRISLLQTLLGLLDRAISTLPAEWAARVRRVAMADLAETQRVDRAYADLRSSTLASAAKAASRGDFKAVERLRAEVEREDARLGHQQPGEVSALLATIALEAEAARYAREVQAAWAKRAPSYRRYRRATNRALRDFKAAAVALDQVKTMTGPPVDSVAPITAKLARSARTLAKVKPPSDMTGSHALVRSAWELASTAFRLRLEAVARNDTEVARQASSAAAGALMLYERARADQLALMEQPARR
jgi:hypothetical protein